MNRVFLYDTTLRDGMQGENIFFSPEDKLKIARRLDDAGIHYIEGGWPARDRFEIPFLHAANSAAILDLPETWLDAVRPGIAIYGLRPSSAVSTDVVLRPALSLISHVGRVRVLPRGASVSYGRTFIAERATTVALLPIGYGDGVHRLLSNRGQALIRGQRAPIIGRVCMDNIMVDVSGIAGVQEGDEAVLIGQQGDERITAEEVAAWAQTINYEVTTSLLPRATRVIVGG
jgi:alanine racemase